jgi:hypothetical protein
MSDTLLTAAIRKVPIKVCTRSRPLLALGLRGEEVLWSLRARLRCDIESRPSLGQRYRRGRHSSEHAVNRGPNGARIQPAKESAWRVLGRPLSCYCHRSRRAPSSLSRLHRPEHGSRGGSEASFAMAHSGYRELQKPPKRYAIIDCRELTVLCGFADLGDFQRAHRQWVEQTVENGRAVRDDHWSQAIAVGSLGFVEKVKGQLGVRGLHRAFEQLAGAYALREPSESYADDFGSKSDALRMENTISWNENAETVET